MVLTVPDLHDDVVALRPPGPSDVVAITAAVQDPEIPRFTHVPAPYTAVDAVAFIDKAASTWRDGTDASFLVVDRTSGVLLGAAGLQKLNAVAGAAWVGYWVDAGARRRGVATRALRLLTAWAFETLGLERLQAQVFTDNPWSQRVLAKAGFQRVPDAPAAVEHAAGPRPAFLYARSRDGADRAVRRGC
jgi:RimJ/RimL family protein N-acetyltransferase